MKLIGTYFSPFSRRVAAALIALNLPYEHDDLNGYADPTRARELNPVGKVPVVMLDDGEYLIDSVAILDYEVFQLDWSHLSAEQSTQATAFLQQQSASGKRLFTIPVDYIRSYY